MNPRPLLALALVIPLLVRAEPAGSIDPCNYANNLAARAGWVAQEGTPFAETREMDGAKVLALSCPFTDPKLHRSAWDHTVALDLSRAEGVELDLRCEKAGPIASFTLYFKSGDGWYTVAFSTPAAGEWETITIPKEGAREEGHPAGWNQISGLRLAAWPGENEDTELFVRNVRLAGVLGGDTQILVAQGAEREAEFAGHVSSLLGDLGLRHALLSEAEITPDTLAKASLVILPYNPDLPSSAVSALADYLSQGGRLLACYSLPAGLESVAGIGKGKHRKPDHNAEFSQIRPAKEAFPGAPPETDQASWNIVATQPVAGRSRVLAEWYDAEGKATGFPAVLASENSIFMTHVLLTDDRERKARLLLAMVGQLRPELCRSVVERHWTEMERIGPYRSFGALVKALAASPTARPLLDDATALRHRSEEAAAAGQFTAALDTADAAVRKARAAFCAGQSPKPGEMRAFWCHSAFGVDGLSWDEAIAKLKAAGFTAIMPNMLWGGVAYYPSEVLPVAPAVATKGDQIALCLAACRKYGLQMHVWKVNWNLGHEVVPAVIEKLRTNHRLQQSADGVEELWLCPSNPQNLKLEHDAMLEVARKYPVDGIHFDYIRYPDANHCFCPSCRERFEKASKKPVAQWPREVQSGGLRRDEWVGWCQGNITALVQSVSKDARKVRPGLKISAAVFRQWDADRAIVMQDWKLWCERGYLDFVCPMDYTANEGTYDAWVRKQKEWAGPALLCPGIGASASRSSLTADKVIDQIAITRRHDTAGFIIFNFGKKEAAELLPDLSLGITKPGL